MLELNTAEIVEHIGRNDTIGSYHFGEYEKHTERRRVADFILGAQPGRVRLLSLPGLSWSFEEMILSERPGSHIVALEHSTTIFMRSRRLMPRPSPRDLASVRFKRFGEITELQDRRRSYGESVYHYSRTTANLGEAKVISAHRLLLMKASVYATMLSTNYGQSHQELVDFHQRFCSRNAVWLDFTSQLCAEVEETLRGLPLVLCPSHEPKPVVLTIMNARDNCRGVVERVARIVAAQPLLKPIDTWTYAGKNGVPMLTVCGEVV